MMKTRRAFFLSLAALLIGGLCNNAAKADTLSPKETYLKYRTALAAAAKVDEITPFLCKRVIGEINQTPAEMKPMFFGMMKETSPKDVQVLSEDIKGEQATLTLKSPTQRSTSSEGTRTETSNGSVSMLKEEGAWKIDKEKWDSTIETK